MILEVTVTTRSENTGHRLAWADLMRTLSIFLVVAVHTSAPVIQSTAGRDFSDWLSGHSLNVIARASVPMLFMLSGFFLLPVDDGMGSFFRRRFQRVVVPFVFWSIFYLFWKRAGYAGYHPIGAIKEILLSLIQGPAEYHLWFVYELLGIYLLVPLFRRMVDGRRETVLWYFTGLWFISGPLLRWVGFFTPYGFEADLGFLSRYIGYFVLGYLLGRLSISRMGSVIAGVVYLLALSGTIYGITYFAYHAPKGVRFLQNLLSLNMVVLSLSCFIWLRELSHAVIHRWPGVIRWIERIAPCSFGIYLVHVWVWNLVRRYGVSSTQSPAWLFILLSAVVVFGVSWGLVALLRRIPGLRWVAG